MDLKELMRREYYGNDVASYAGAVVVFLATLFGFLLARRLILSRLQALAKKTITDLDDIAVEVLGLIKAPECYLVAFYFAMRPLDLPARFDKSVHSLVVVVVAYRLVTMLSETAGYALGRLILADGDDPAHRETAATVTLAVRGLIWAGALLFVLGNFGFNVTSMLAGLGIGGIAVALAAQAVLGDLFSAVAIYLDKPFVVGDGIKVGDAVGTVQHIGVKTTRVRSVTGEMLVFPNASLTSARIQNYRDLLTRRSLFTFLVPLGTPAEALRKVPGRIQHVIEKTPTVRFERAHLTAFREHGFEFEAVFHVLDVDYNVFMDRQQDVLLGVLDALRADGVTLAAPARSIVVEREISRPA